MNHVQTIKKVDHSGIGTDVVSAAFNTTVSHALLICGACLTDVGAGNPTSTGAFLDGGGGANVFTQDKTVQLATGDSRLYLFSLADVTPGSHTVTVNRNSTNVTLSFFVTEASGAVSSSPQDGLTAGSGTGTGTSIASSNLGGVTLLDDFWIAVFMNEFAGAEGAIAATGAWTLANSETNSGGSDIVSGAAYIENAGTLTGAATFTVANAAAWGVLAMAYKAKGRRWILGGH
jgi:hypothetical protein